MQTEAITLNDKLKIVDDKYSTLPADHFLSEQDKQLQNCFQDNKHVQEIVKLEVGINHKVLLYLASGRL